jgi:hypothetical protein
MKGKPHQLRRLRPLVDLSFTQTVSRFLTDPFLIPTRLVRGPYTLNITRSRPRGHRCHDFGIYRIRKIDDALPTFAPGSDRKPSWPCAVLIWNNSPMQTSHVRGGSRNDGHGKSRTEAGLFLRVRFRKISLTIRAGLMHHRIANIERQRALGEPNHRSPAH